jgi:uncharacterized membrane protein YkoI
MFHKLVIAPLATALLLAGLCSVANAAASDPAAQLKALPPAVQKAIEDQLSGGTLEEITRTNEGGQAVYEVDMVRDRRDRSFTISARGELLSRQVFLNELPEPVHHAIRAHQAKSRLGEIDEVFENGESTYEVEMIRGGKTGTTVFSKEGRLIDMQVFLDETPPAVQAAIQKEAAGGKCGEISKSVEDRKVSYELTINKAGKSISLTLDSKGGILSREEPVTIAETPAEVQQTITARLQGAKLLKLTKVTEESDTTYVLELSKAGQRESVSIEPDGDIAAP